MNWSAGERTERKENALTENELRTTASADISEPAEEEIRLNEEIVRTLRKLNAMSRRGPRPDPELPPPPDAPRDPRGDMKHEHGRGRIMAMLNDGGAMSQCRLAHLLDIRPQSLSELLVKMEGDGLIERVQSEEDRRQIIVSLTEEGSARVASFRETHRRAAAEFLSPLTLDEKNTLVRLLKKLTDARSEEPFAKRDGAHD